DAVRLHFLEVLNQHLFTDAGDQSAQLSEATGLHTQRPQNEHLPFPADHFEGGLQAAGIGLLSHHESSPPFAAYAELSTCLVEIKLVEIKPADAGRLSPSGKPACD